MTVSSVYPGAVWMPVLEAGGLMSRHLGLVCYIQQWQDRPVFPANQTWWISRTGTVEQYVDADMAAWAARSEEYNSAIIEGYEHEGLTSAQTDALASLYRWGHDTYGWPFATADVPRQSGLMWPGPGDAQRLPILRIASGQVVLP